MSPRASVFPPTFHFFSEIPLLAEINMCLSRNGESLAKRVFLVPHPLVFEHGRRVAQWRASLPFTFHLSSRKELGGLTPARSDQERKKYPKVSRGEEEEACGVSGRIAYGPLLNANDESELTEIKRVRGGRILACSRWKAIFPLHSKFISSAYAVVS